MNRKVSGFKIIIAILLVISIIQAFNLVLVMTEDYISPSGFTSFHYALEDGRYGKMVRLYHTNQMYKDQRKVTGDDFKEYYAIAQYVEAAVDYRIYEATEDSKRAEEKLAEMKEAKADMGILSFETEKIDEKLGITVVIE